MPKKKLEKPIEEDIVETREILEDVFKAVGELQKDKKVRRKA